MKIKSLVLIGATLFMASPALAGSMTCKVTYNSKQLSEFLSAYKDAGCTLNGHIVLPPESFQVDLGGEGSTEESLSAALAEIRQAPQLTKEVLKYGQPIASVRAKEAQRRGTSFIVKLHMLNPCPKIPTEFSYSPLPKVQCVEKFEVNLDDI